jgi:hypothetical protein
MTKSDKSNEIIWVGVHAGAQYTRIYVLSKPKLLVLYTGVKSIRFELRTNDQNNLNDV